MTVLMKYNASEAFVGQCVGGKPLLQAAGEILMNTNMDYMSAFKTAQIQLQMANSLLGCKNVVGAEAPPTVGGKSGAIGRA